jgi:hypothetical protein
VHYWTAKPGAAHRYSNGREKLKKNDRKPNWSSPLRALFEVDQHRLRATHHVQWGETFKTSHSDSYMYPPIGQQRLKHGPSRTIKTPWNRRIPIRTLPSESHEIQADRLVSRLGNWIWTGFVVLSWTSMAPQGGFKLEKLVFVSARAAGAAEACPSLAAALFHD